MRRVVLFLFLGIQINGFAAELDTIHITYTDSVEAFFALVVPKALEQGIISKGLKKKQPATLGFKGRSFPAKIRLKGDWTDHIKPDKWSLRVNLQEGNVYDARKFSLQFPETRGGENERIFHEELRKRDILTTFYTYVHLYVNESYWGVFAFEEHFDEPLLERNARPSGPLLKFDEDGFWECKQQTAQYGEDLCVEYPIFDAARIRPFGKKKTFRDTVQVVRFNSARGILTDWRNGKIDKNKIDLERFAEYYALCDAFGFYHGLQWHNQRFYYRAADGKIEPVAFDCFSETNELIGKELLGQFDEHYDTVYFNELWFNYQLFTIPEFTAHYEMCMARYVEGEEWEIENLPKEIHARLKGRVERIKSYNELVKTREIRPIPAYYAYEQWKKDYPDLTKKYSKKIPDQPLKNVQLVPVLKGEILSIRNYHPKSLKMIGYQLDSQMVWLVNGHDIVPNETVKFVYGHPKKVFARTSAGDTISSKVDEIIPTSDSLGRVGDWRNYFEFIDEVWTWKNAIVSLNEKLILPKGNEFLMEESKVMFGEYGLIICYGNLSIQQSSIRANETGNSGIHVIDGDLYLENSIIAGFKVLPKFSNGPIQVLNGDAKIYDTQVYNIEAEDAINFVNCEVFCRGLEIKNCSGDGLDLDFCSGQIIGGKIKACLGDGLDFSGSQVEINSINILGCLDKGLSVGERSTVKMAGSEISGCAFGIAVKDESVLRLEETKISNCETSINAFRKKPFYLAGGIVSLIDSNIEVLVDEYSKIINE